MHRRHALNQIALALAGGAGAAGAQTPTAPPPAPMPRLSAGRLERHERFASRHVDPRPVDVWLPPGYDGRKPHAVLVMHDGQMLFDPRTTWNQQAWELDRMAAPLLAAGSLRDFIVVAPWNNGTKRFAEYFPARWLELMSDAEARSLLEKRGLQGPPLADGYLRFLVEELLPHVRSRYATLGGPENTCLMGSSMGGLISWYGLLEHPQVFGGAAGLSTHWIGAFERNEAVPNAALAYLRQKLPAPGARRLYSDRGTTELDAQYDQAHERVDALLRERGHREPHTVLRVFEGTGHNERAWRDRLAVPLGFLLGRG